MVDDGSSDNTIKVAKNLGISVFLHGNNLGYGANQKTCYAKALLLNPQVVVMLHPDYQYDATKIDKLVKPILQGDYDFVFGSRIATRNGALDGGMPKIKYFINFNNVALYTTKSLLTIPQLCYNGNRKNIVIN